jgi:hypothetical protein
MKGILLTDFLPHGETINAHAYCITLKRLQHSIQNRRRGLLTSRVFASRQRTTIHCKNKDKVREIWEGKP